MIEYLVRDFLFIYLFWLSLTLRFLRVDLPRGCRLGARSITKRSTPFPLYLLETAEHNLVVNRDTWDESEPATVCVEGEGLYLEKKASNKRKALTDQMMPR